MEQHVNGPTHVSGNTLDLIQSDREGIINAVRGAGRLGKSDHEIILFLMRVDKKRASEERSWLNYRKAAYEQLRVTLKAERWDDELRESDANEAWQCIRDKIKMVIAEHTPKKRLKKRNEPPWMNKEVKKSIEAKRETWKKWKETMREIDRANYKKTKTQTKKIDHIDHKK